MMLYKLIACSFLVLTPMVALIVIKLLKLRRFRLIVTDIALPLYVLEIVLVSAYFFNANFIFYWLIPMAILAIFTTFREIKRKGEFAFRPFLKFFWRGGFFITLITYFALIIALFLTKSA